MKAYTVYEPPKPAPGRLQRAEQLVFVREGFSWTAALFAPLWMLAHRMWLVVLFFIVGLVALDLILLAAGVDSHWIVLANVALHLVVGFESGGLRRWTLERKGWRMVGTVSGRTEAECERRFFESWLAEKAQEPGRAPRDPAPSARAGPDHGVPAGHATQSA